MSQQPGGEEEGEDSAITCNNNLGRKRVARAGNELGIFFWCCFRNNLLKKTPNFSLSLARNEPFIKNQKTEGGSLSQVCFSSQITSFLSICASESTLHGFNKTFLNFFYDGKALYGAPEVCHLDQDMYKRRTCLSGGPKLSSCLQTGADHNECCIIWSFFGGSCPS